MKGPGYDEGVMMGRKMDGTGFAQRQKIKTGRRGIPGRGI